MNFNKRNTNFAAKRNLSLDIDYDCSQTVSIYELGEEEPIIVYNINVEKDELFFHGQVYGEEIEDLPYWIKSSKELNQVVDYVSKELTLLKIISVKPPYDK